jgi:SAM-dependent methyltransferase
VEVDTPLTSPGLLGDTVVRDYSRKLVDFNSFAEPELRRLLAGLKLRPGMSALDAGCGTGAALGWLRDELGPQARVVGIDLSAPHVAVARSRVPDDIQVHQGNLLDAPFLPNTFDLIWCVNTLNHLHDPAQGVRSLASLLRPGGRIALGQSSLVPDMYFAWDARLERVTNEAVRHYYRERFNLDEHSLAAVRALVGVLRRSELRDVTSQTIMLERVSPVDAATRAYIVDTLFHNTWGERLRPYMLPADHRELMQICDPHDPRFALSRPDFHFLQSFTLCVGTVQ